MNKDDENKVIELSDGEEIEEPENNEEEKEKWTFWDIVKAIFYLLIIVGLLIWIGFMIYGFGYDAAESKVLITRENLPEILAQEFNQNEIERIMTEIKNIHYDIEGSFGSSETIIIHQGHIGSYHDAYDDWEDITINLYYSSWQNKWEISSYVWSNRYGCVCGDCQCSCVVPSQC